VTEREREEKASERERKSEKVKKRGRKRDFCRVYCVGFSYKLAKKEMQRWKKETRKRKPSPTILNSFLMQGCESNYLRCFLARFTRPKYDCDTQSLTCFPKFSYRKFASTIS